MVTGRRAYATARTNDDVSDTPGDQRVCGCWFERHTDRNSSRLLRVDGTQVAATRQAAGTRWLSFTDGPSCDWSDEYPSARRTGGHPAPAQAPSRLGTGHAVSCTQNACVLARSAS